MPSTQRGAGWAWPLFMVLKVARRRTYVKYIYDLINIWEGPGIKGGEGEPGTPTEGKEGLTTDFRDDTDGAGKGGTRIKGGTGPSTTERTLGVWGMVGPAGRTRIARSLGTTWARRERMEQTEIFTEGNEGNEGWTTDFRDDTDAAGKGGTRIKGGTGLSTKKCSKGQRWLVGLRISRVSDTLVVGHALRLGLRHSRGPGEVDRTVG